MKKSIGKMIRVTLEYPDNFEEWQPVHSAESSGLLGPCGCRLLEVGGKPLSEWRADVLEHNRDKHATEVPPLQTRGQKGEVHVHSASCHGAIGELLCGNYGGNYGNGKVPADREMERGW